MLADHAPLAGRYEGHGLEGLDNRSSRPAPTSVVFEVSLTKFLAASDAGRVCAVFSNADRGGRDALLRVIGFTPKIAASSNVTA